MGRVSAHEIELAKTGTAQPCGNRRRALRLNAAVMQKARDLNPIKTSHYLADITGYSLRTCEYWLSEKVVIPSDALAALIRSEQGRDFLAEVMADQTPRWWKQLKAWIAATNILAVERKLKREKKRLLETINGEEIEYGPATSFAEMLHDPEFAGAQVAPVGSTHRSMASRRVR